MPIRKRAAITPAPVQEATDDKTKPNIVYISVDRLIPDEDNPNVMSETVFDALVEEIREQGFDEPILAREAPGKKGWYEIGSGHHRLKAAKVLGYHEVPVILKNWTDREKKLALTKRNVLRGDVTDKAKLVKLYSQLVKGSDPKTVQREMGFHDSKRFEVLIESAKANMTPAQRKKLDEAKETIKSVDDLSSVLNRIFKESGSQLDRGYMVFSFGGKEHHYFQIDEATNVKLKEVIKMADAADVPYTKIMEAMVAAADLQSIVASANAKKPAAPTVTAKKRTVSRSKTK
jgi:hypothetical protein